MRDFHTFKTLSVDPHRRHLFECKDSKSDTGHSLLVRMAATHAGIVNGNRRFYRPDKMQDGVHTWLPKMTKDGVVIQTPRPVLIQHNEHGDVLGRVLEARYVDDSWRYVNEFPMVKDFLFYQRDGKKRHDLFKSVDWVVKNLMPLNEYTGLGYTELGVRITNPDGIRKVLADEYLTVSVGFKTDSAICSICHTDWAVDSKCEHKVGEKVDGEQMFLIAGCFDNEEVSFINFAADPFATTISKEMLNDGLNKSFFLGLSLQKQRTFEATGGVHMTDGLVFEADIVATEGPMTIAGVETLIDPAKVRDEIKAADLTKDKALALKAELAAWQPETDELKTDRRSLVSTLNARIRKNGWDAANIAQDEQIAAELAELIDDAHKEVTVGTSEVDVCNWDNWDQEATEEDKSFFADIEGINEEMELELDAAVAAGEVPAQDAKLSTESRKKLSGGTFCGPGRSFPVPDCAHVTAARRLIGRAKVSDATKAKILSCVSGKASKLGCGAAKKKDEQTATTTGTIATVVTVDSTAVVSEEITALATAAKLLDVDTSAAGAANEAVKAKEVLGLYDGLDKHHKGASDGLKWKMQELHMSLGERWSKDNWVQYCRKTVGEHKDYVVLTKVELGEKDETLNGLMTEKDALAKENAALKDSRQAILDASKRTLAQQIVMHGVLTGQDAYKDLKPEQLDEKVTELAKRHITSLKDTVQDILSSIKWVKNTDSTSTTVASLKPMDNNTRVTDDVRVGSTATDSARIQAEDQASHEKFLIKLRYMTVPERDRCLADLAFEAAKKA